MVLSGSRTWSAGHEDDLICFGRLVGSCRDRWLCQRCSRHEDLLGAAGTPVLLSIFGWAAWASAPRPMWLDPSRLTHTCRERNAIYRHTAFLGMHDMNQIVWSRQATGMGSEETLGTVPHRTFLGMVLT